MKDRIRITIAVCCLMALVMSGAVWLAHGQTTNEYGVATGFQKPLVRDLEMLNEVRALARKVEQLEEKVKNLEARSGIRPR